MKAPGIWDDPRLSQFAKMVLYWEGAASAEAVKALGKLHWMRLPGVGARTLREIGAVIDGWDEDKIVRRSTPPMTLNERQKAVLALRETGFTHKQIGDMLGVSAARSQQVYMRARRNLARMTANSWRGAA